MKPDYNTIHSTRAQGRQTAGGVCLGHPRTVENGLVWVGLPRYECQIRLVRRFFIEVAPAKGSSSNPDLTRPVAADTMVKILYSPWIRGMLDLPADNSDGR
jgi:hypothetical protein